MISLIVKKFPGVPVLPVYGNNDMLVNYQIPGGDIVTTYDFFNETHYSWFKDKELAEQTATSFKNGGYYEFPVQNQNLSIIGLNTIYFNYKLREKNNT